MCVAHVFRKEALCTCRVPAPDWMVGRLRGEATGWSAVAVSPAVTRPRVAGSHAGGSEGLESKMESLTSSNDTRSKGHCSYETSPRAAPADDVPEPAWSRSGGRLRGPSLVPSLQTGRTLAANRLPLQTGALCPTASKRLLPRRALPDGTGQRPCPSGDHRRLAARVCALPARAVLACWVTSCLFCSVCRLRNQANRGVKHHGVWNPEPALEFC